MLLSLATSLSLAVNPAAELGNQVVPDTGREIFQMEFGAPTPGDDLAILMPDGPMDFQRLHGIMTVIEYRIQQEKQREERERILAQREAELAAQSQMVQDTANKMREGQNQDAKNKGNASEEVAMKDGKDLSSGERVELQLAGYRDLGEGTTARSLGIDNERARKFELGAFERRKAEAA